MENNTAEARTLGQMIGIVKHTFSIKNSHDVIVKSVTVMIDFRSASDIDIKSWLCGNRIIAGQRVWRALSEREIKTNVDGATFIAENIGQKVKSRDEQIMTLARAFMASGQIDAENALKLATAAFDNPTALTIKVEDEKAE